MKLIIHFAAYMSVSLGATDEHPSITKITANSTDTDVVARYGGNWEIYWALVFPGLLSVLLSLAVIWKNERKIVQMKGVYREAEKQMFVNQDYSKVKSSNEKELVHMSGRASTYEDVWVEDLAYQRANVYWIRVTAEMFQVVENRTKIHDSSRFATYYS